MAMISIIVTCYNLEKYISKCLKSIQDQTYTDYEVLIIDDGSVDNSAKVIKEKIKNDKRFIYYKKKNGGVSSARNFGLEKATGKYICFVDGDDHLEKNYLECLYQSVSSGDHDFSICNIKRVYKNTNTFNIVDKNAVYQCRYPALWNKMCRKELFDKYHIRFLENVWYEDLAAGTEIFLVSNSFVVTNQYLYNYMQHDNSLMRTYDDKIFDIYKITEEIENFAKKNDVYKSKYSSIEFISVYHILIGTIYRASFHKHFSIKMIKEIYCNVCKKYDKWYNNEYIKNLPISFKIYLLALRMHCFLIIYILLKLFNKKLHL